MSDSLLFAFGCGVTFLCLAAGYILARADAAPSPVRVAVHPDDQEQRPRAVS